MTTTTQAAGVPEGAFAVAPYGRGVVVPQARNAPISQRRPTPEPFAANPAGPAWPAPAALPTLSLCRIRFARRVADARPRRLPIPVRDRLHRFIPE